MNSNILHNIAVWMALFMLALLVACRGPEDPEVPETPEVSEASEAGLYLKVATLSQSRDTESSLLSNEKIGSLRVVVLHENGKVEHNKYFRLLSSGVDRHLIYLKVTPDEKKKVFLFANEESVSSVGGIDGTSSLTEFFEYYTENTVGFEAAINALYFAPDYSGGKFIPMSSLYEVEMGKGYLEQKFYVVRVATKFTVTFENRRDQNVKIQSFSISSHADKNYLMAHVIDSEQNRQLFNGRSWIEWLREVSAASSEADTGAAGWLKDYELPSVADLNKTYEHGEISVNAWNSGSSTPDRQQAVFYLPESKNPKEGASDGEQEYTLTVKIDGIDEPFIRKLPNLKALFRNTHVVINVTMFTNEIRFKIDVEPWSFGGRTEIEIL